MKTNVTANSQKGDSLFGFVVLVVFFVGCTFTGCVSIKTNEQCKIRAFEEGVIHGVYMAANEIEKSDLTKEELAAYLNGFADAENLRLLKMDSLK